MITQTRTTVDPIDTKWLTRTLELAARGRGDCAPNPAVGAVIVKADQVISEGYHHAAGQPHAEIEALTNARQTVNGATMYVSLEPCCVYGKTPPCTTALIDNGISKVVYAYQDPNPQVAGKGQAALLAAGIECYQVSMPAIDAFYHSYQHWVTCKKPWVRIKLAMSRDGKVAGPQGEPVAITNDSVNQFTHQQRQRTDAILTSINTVVNDNPKLNVRLANKTISKPVYVLDPNLTFPLHVQLITTARKVIVLHRADLKSSRKTLLTDHGVECVAVPTMPSSSRHLDLAAVLAIIGAQGNHDLWIEVGPRLTQTWLQSGEVNECYFYIGDKKLGEAAMPGLWSAADLCVELANEQVCQQRIAKLLPANTAFTVEKLDNWVLWVKVL